jgi:hypothetical protein
MAIFFFKVEFCSWTCLHVCYKVVITITKPNSRANLPFLKNELACPLIFHFILAHGLLLLLTNVHGQLKCLHSSFMCVASLQHCSGENISYLIHHHCHHLKSELIHLQILFSMFFYSSWPFFFFQVQIVFWTFFHVCYNINGRREAQLKATMVFFSPKWAWSLPSNIGKQRCTQ